MIDSLEMNDSHFEKIISKCKNCNTDKIIITHGTDRMVETAKAIAQAELKNKTIILTGAMIPYAFGSSSDGFFNLGCALSYVQTLNKGVYITMQGQYFSWNEVVKNTKKGGFERTKSPPLYN
jgi:L-asparaginase